MLTDLILSDRHESPQVVEHRHSSFSKVNIFRGGWYGANIVLIGFMVTISWQKITAGGGDVFNILGILISIIATSNPNMTATSNGFLIKSNYSQNLSKVLKKISKLNRYQVNQMKNNINKNLFKKKLDREYQFKKFFSFLKAL